MEIVLFQVRTRSDLDETAYVQAFEHMVVRAAEVPGFIDIKGFAAEDGSELAVARFDSPEAVAQWRDHPDHVETRRRGREEFFESYDITVAAVSRQYDWTRSAVNAGASAVTT